MRQCRNGRKIVGPQGMLYLKTQGISSEVYTHGDDTLAATDSVESISMNRFTEVCEPLFWNINTWNSWISHHMEDNTSFLTTMIQFDSLNRNVREKQKTR